MVGWDACAEHVTAVSAAESKVQSLAPVWIRASLDDVHKLLIAPMARCLTHVTFKYGSEVRLGTKTDLQRDINQRHARTQQEILGSLDAAEQ